MPAYSFRPIFIDPILWGRKRQTIRAERRGRNPHAHDGDALALYTGMRTRSCRLILRTVCTGTQPVLLRWRPVIEVHVSGERLENSLFDAFAQRDGFDDFSAMERFWGEHHRSVDVFRGVLIEWQGPASPVEMGTDLTKVAA